MTTAIFDTHTFIKRLTASGMPESQAEAVAEALRDTREPDLSQLVTKLDLRAELSDAKADIMKWIIGALGIQTLAILGGLVTLLKVANH